MEHERDMAKRPVDGPEMRIPDSFFKSPNLRLGQLTIGFLTGQRREGSEDHEELIDSVAARPVMTHQFSEARSNRTLLEVVKVEPLEEPFSLARVLDTDLEPWVLGDPAWLVVDDVDNVDPPLRSNPRGQVCEYRLHCGAPRFTSLVAW